MRRTRVFRTMGRVKTILNLILGFLLLLFLLYAGYEIAKSKLTPREVPNVVNMEQSGQVAVKWNLGTFEALPGTQSLVAPAYSVQNYQVSYYEKDASAIRNYLFMNAEDKSSRWLMPNNRSLVLSLEKLTVSGVPPETRVVKWIWYTIVKTDTNQDGRLTGGDRQTIAISTPSGEGYTELLQNVEQVLGSTFRNGQSLLIMHRTNGTNAVSEIDLAKGQVVLTKALAPITP